MKKIIRVFFILPYSISSCIRRMQKYFFHENGTVFLRGRIANLILCSSLSVATMAQESVNSASHEATGTGGSSNYSIGQVVYKTNTGGNYSESQGVQQPFEISIISALPKHPEINLSCKVYPNPSTDYLNLEVENLESDMTFALYSLDGKLLKSSELTDNQTNLSMGNYIPATYLLTVKQGEKTIQTFKIIKN